MPAHAGACRRNMRGLLDGGAPRKQNPPHFDFTHVFLGSSAVERRTVNPLVVGSIPTRGAKFFSDTLRYRAAARVSGHNSRVFPRWRLTASVDGSAILGVCLRVCRRRRSDTLRVCLPGEPPLFRYLSIAHKECLSGESEETQARRVTLPTVRRPERPRQEQGQGFEPESETRCPGRASTAPCWRECPANRADVRDTTVFLGKRPGSRQAPVSCAVILRFCAPTAIAMRRTRLVGYGPYLWVVR